MKHSQPSVSWGTCLKSSISGAMVSSMNGNGFKRSGNSTPLKPSWKSKVNTKSNLDGYPVHPPRNMNVYNQSLYTLAPDKSMSGARAAAHFESTSKDYDKIMKVLGRNRKYLVNVFSKISRIKVMIIEKLIALDLWSGIRNSGTVIPIPRLPHRCELLPPVVEVRRERWSHRL